MGYWSWRGWRITFQNKQFILKNLSVNIIFVHCTICFVYLQICDPFISNMAVSDLRLTSPIGLRLNSAKRLLPSSYKMVLFWLGVRLWRQAGLGWGFHRDLLTLNMTRKPKPEVPITRLKANTPILISVKCSVVSGLFSGTVHRRFPIGTDVLSIFSLNGLCSQEIALYISCLGTCGHFFHLKYPEMLR